VSAAALLSGSVAFAQRKYDNGATDAEIKIGHTGPYSGPAAAYGVIGKGIEAYWKSVNEAGGINGRKVNFITLDDGYSPAKCVEACADWSSRTRCCAASTRSARRRTRPSRST
jgi:ABC-type branched-subunit amino acid transport system substrate-binding protein